MNPDDISALWRNLPSGTLLLPVRVIVGGELVGALLVVPDAPDDWATLCPVLGAVGAAVPQFPRVRTRHEGKERR